MVNLFYVGAPIIRKYINNFCDILSNKDKLYVVYIHTFTSECLKSRIKILKNILSI
jgi:hypothetical protein